MRGREEGAPLCSTEFRLRARGFRFFAQNLGLNLVCFAGTAYQAIPPRRKPQKTRKFQKIIKTTTPGGSASLAIGHPRKYSMPTLFSVVTCATPFLGRRGSVLLQGMVGSVTCVAAHPLLPRLMVLCDSGDIHLWDYNLKVRTKLIICQSDRPHLVCLVIVFAFQRTG